MTAEPTATTARNAIDYRIDVPTQERIIEALNPRRIPATPAPNFANGGIIPKAHVSVSLEFIRGVDAALAHFLHTNGPSGFDAIIAAEVLRQMPKEAAK